MNCSISLCSRVTLVDLIEVDMLDFDVILGIDHLHACVLLLLNVEQRYSSFNFLVNPS